MNFKTNTLQRISNDTEKFNKLCEGLLSYATKRKPKILELDNKYRNKNLLFLKLEKK